MISVSVNHGRMEVFDNGNRIGAVVGSQKRGKVTLTYEDNQYGRCYFGESVTIRQMPEIIENFRLRRKSK
jgi:hypothetical protein